MENYDSWKLQTPEQYKGLKEFCECECCGSVIYEGEIYYNIMGKKYCQYCIEDCEETAGE